MPRRRHHHRHYRLEWTNSMQSQITLVDQPLYQINSPPASAPATAAVSGAGAGTDAQAPTRLRGISAAAAASTFGADTFAADIRPVQIRASSQQQPSSLLAQNAHRAARTQTLPLSGGNASSAARAAAAEQGANAGAARDASKIHIGFVRRAKETLKRQLRILGHSIRHLPEGSITADGYYHPVSLN
ncbi:hypothetical protein LPJ56_005849 [Coemansia sp. RSA 2599]|nr:hypothetical protein LPJ75_005872 [Coemansia sp. RSA 2598]KAJ1810972.1 hypothetical protein LPJ56_005849 [Coemansia sp. RSA 2599]